ncbi:integrase core domain-containing protein [Actinomadura keratinilytica]|uniref:integrase core domain-containing protein n=1 Tax=Actinomadura keratinilytica TaxID=547461 RepID=UPI003619DA31
MSHRNAPLTPTGRLRLARCVVEDGRPLRRAAERFGVSHTTAARWAARYRQPGAAGMHDRTRPPASQPQPDTTAPRGAGARPAPGAPHRPTPPGRPHRHRPLHRAPHPDPPRPAAPGRLRPGHRRTHPPLASTNAPATWSTSTSKSLGRIPDGGGHRVLGRAAGRVDRHRDGAGYLYLHTALDDHSRLAYTEILSDETAATCAAFLVRATAWFAARGIAVRRVLTDNAWACTKTTWRATCAELGIRPRWTRPWRPQTNGKVERFHRTLLEEWAYHQPYTSEAERQAAFGDWLDWYNHHRPHAGIAGQTPADRVTNLSEQHT